MSAKLHAALVTALINQPKNTPVIEQVAFVPAPGKMPSDVFQSLAPGHKGSLLYPPSQQRVSSLEIIKKQLDNEFAMKF